MIASRAFFMIASRHHFRSLLIDYSCRSSRFDRKLCFAVYAHHPFDETHKRSPLQVNRSMLDALHRNLPIHALRILKENVVLGSFQSIDAASVSLALKACRGETKPGCEIHGFALASGYISYITVSNAIMSMYSKAGKFKKALNIFENLIEPDTVSWNTILSGFGKSEEALIFVRWMNSSGVVFDAFTYTTALSFCLDNEGFVFGSQLHSLIMKVGLDADVFVGNALITMYFRWGRPVEARGVFDEMTNRDLISWNSLLSGYAQGGGYGFEAILAFREMVRERFKLDHVSFTSAISACGHETEFGAGRQIHGLCIKKACESHVSVSNVLMSLYSKCGLSEEAKCVFDRMRERNVVSWTTMISVNEEDAMSIFYGMLSDGVYPNEVTLVGLLHAITCRNLVEEGLMIHGFCMKTGFVLESIVCNSLITMYSKFETMKDATKVFEELHQPEIISWNALISGFAQNGFFRAAIKTFLSAITQTVPNEYTFGSVLKAIAEAEDISLKHGQRCHAHIIKLGLNSCPVVFSALLGMYAKRGSIYESEKLFYEMFERNQFAWTSIISAHGRHGDYESVMNLFQEMVAENVKPDSITFLSVLTTCGRKGMVDTGYQIFNSMIKDFKIQPSHEHYSCMVDMLGRAGRLNEAEDLMGQIPGGPRLSVLQSVLGSCRVHGNVELGERVAKLVMEMEPEGSGSYVLMSNLYAEKGEWEKVARIRRGMRDKGVRKEVGFSWVDAGNDDIEGSLSLHGFSSGDMSHCKSLEICLMAKLLGSEMRFDKRRHKKELFETFH